MDAEEVWSRRGRRWALGAGAWPLDADAPRTSRARGSSGARCGTATCMLDSRTSIQRALDCARRRYGAANASGELATRIPRSRRRLQRHLPGARSVHQSGAIFIDAIAVTSIREWLFENRIDRYPGEVESVHHSLCRESAAESFVLTRPISWRFTPLALDTLRKQRIRIENSPSQHARVPADIYEPRWHQPPRLRQPLSPR
jgi:hypothetical protein